MRHPDARPVLPRRMHLAEQLRDLRQALVVPGLIVPERQITLAGVEDETVVIAGIEAHESRAWGRP